MGPQFFSDQIQKSPVEESKLNQIYLLGKEEPLLNLLLWDQELVVLKDYIFKLETEAYELIFTQIFLIGTAKFSIFLLCDVVVKGE